MIPCILYPEKVEIFLESIIKYNKKENLLHSRFSFPGYIIETINYIKYYEYIKYNKTPSILAQKPLYFKSKYKI